jgi:hypothetical protein
MKQMIQSMTASSVMGIKAMILKVTVRMTWMIAMMRWRRGAYYINEERK